MGNKNNINSSRRERNVEADINYWGVIYIFILYAIYLQPITQD